MKGLISDLGRLGDDVDEFLGEGTPRAGKGPEIREKGTAYTVIAGRRPECTAPGSRRLSLPRNLPSLPPMVEKDVFEDEEDGTGLPGDRYTADVREDAAAAVRLSRGITGEAVFGILRGVLERSFRQEMENDREFLRVKYFVRSTPEMIPVCGRFAPVFNEALPDLRWPVLRDAVRGSRRAEASADGPRGIHLVHDPVHSDGKGRFTVPMGATPPFSMDISIDGRGSLDDPTREVEVWWSLAVYAGEAAHAAGRLAYTGRIVQASFEAIAGILTAMGRPPANGSALAQFFSLMDPARMALPGNHAVDLSRIPEGSVLVEYSCRARLAGTEARVVLDDSNGCLHKVASDLVESSKRFGMPLVHFSVGLGADRRTVTFERRYM